MLEPNDAEFAAENADEACKSDYFSDEGDTKNDSVKSENTLSGKRKPGDNDVLESKKIKISEHPSSKSSAASQPNTSEFVRAGSVASDNSDEFVDASDVLLDAPPLPDKTSKNDSRLVKSPPPGDTFKSSVFEPEVPKVKDNKFIKRLPTFADDPLERFNSSVLRRGLVKEVEPTKPIDLNFDFGDKDKNEPKGENKAVKKVKLNRSKFFPTGRPKFSDESSSDSNSKFNTTTSPVKSDIPPPLESKERNFKSVNNVCEDKPIKPAVQEKPPVPVEPLPVVQKNEKLHVGVKPAPEPETSSASMKNATKLPESIIPVSQPLPAEPVERKVTGDNNVLPPKPVNVNVSEANDIENIAEDEITDSKHNKPLQEIEEEITLLHSEQDVTQPTDEVDKIVISEETFEEIDQNVIYTTEKNSPQITEEMTPGTEKAEKLEDAAPLNTEDEFPLNSNDCIEIDTDDDNQQEKYAESIDQLVNEEIQPTLDMASESPEIVPQPSEYENISVTDINVPNTESPSNLQSAGIIEEVLSDTATDTILEEELIDSQIPVETEVVSIMDTEPEAKTVENADSASEVDDLQEDKSEHELSNDESEEDGEEEEDEDEEGEEEEEEEIIHEEEVYLEDRLPVYHSRPESPSPKRKSPSPQPALSPPRHIGNDVIEVDSDESQPAAIAESSEAQESPVQEPHRATSFENIEDIPMEVDDDHKIPSSSSDALLSDDQTKPKGLSKLEQALTSKPPKRPEVQVPEISDEEVKNVIDDYVSEPKENEETKEKIKLHLSLQGDKVCIKKGPVDTTPAVVRVKRQYRKRRLEDLKTTDKTYKLRNRTIKKDGEANEPSQSNDTVEVVNVKEKPIEVSAPIERKQILVPSRSGEPLTIDLDDSDSSGETSKQPPATKIQPIKLKIGKNANVTIESGPLNEDVRKKDAAFSNYMEQAATAWSGPDLQRVERLLKESNITITPVVPKDSTPQTSTPCVIKPILKEKPTVVPPKFSTPSSAITAATSLQTTTAAVTPITKDKRDDQEIDLTPTKTQNGDSCELEESLPKIKIDLTPVSLTRQIDVKSEIRKKLASVEKKKQDSGKESNDSESESDSKPKPKSVPDLIPANFPTPEMLQSLASSLGVNTTPEGESADGKSKPDIDPAFLPLLQTLPKKRGRPTKAMVAAREALKQSQETALENLRQLASQKNGDTEELMAHFPIPLFDMTDPENPFKSKRGRKPRSERLDKSDGDQSAVEDPIMDPVREQEEIKRLEEERIKKEEEKERRNEIRRQKARERNDLVKAKRLRQKMKAEERQKRMQEKRRQLQEEKKKLEEEIKNLPQSIPGFDDETRMSAENSQLQTTSYSIGMGDEDSSNATTEFSQRVKKGRMEVTDADSKDLTVDQIAEYQWPIQGGDLYMIQEQVSNYLGVKSFKRKYPDIKRRPVDSEERAYLVDSGLVSETLCDLGLTAVSSAELLDIMCADFPDKYEELRRYMREKQMKELSFKQKAWASGLGYKFLMADGTKQDLKKRAMDAASNWNSALNKSRSEDRRCAMDLQTFIVHYPKDRTQKMSISTPKMGSYPVSILPGQFCDFYKSYTSTELRYMPINTVLYGPLKPHDVNIVGDGSQTDSDDSSSSDESSTTSEGTQATEDTIEDTDKDMSVDESSQLDKTNEINMLKDAMSMELSENTRELIMDEAAKILCKVCLGNMARNKENVPEVLICCSQCSSTNHPTCLDLSLDMVPHIKKYPWQCPDCKICARCKTNTDEDKMLFCDTCDRGYHIFCVGLKRVPSGNWQCQECVSVEHNICINSSVVREVFKEPGLIEIQDG